MRDYIKEVAKAIANDDPQLHNIASEAISAIERERTALQQKVFTIRSMVAHYPTPARPNRTVVGGGISQAKRQAEESGGLTKEERDHVRREIDRQLSQNPNVTPQEIVDALAQRGIRLSVSQPTSVVGTMLYHARGPADASRPEA